MDLLIYAKQAKHVGDLCPAATRGSPRTPDGIVEDTVSENQPLNWISRLTMARSAILSSHPKLHSPPPPPSAAGGARQAARGNPGSRAGGELRRAPAV